jgi:hypothetical protein
MCSHDKEKTQKIPPKYGWLDDTMMYSREKILRLKKSCARRKKRENQHVIWCGLLIQMNTAPDPIAC